MGAAAAAVPEMLSILPTAGFMTSVTTGLMTSRSPVAVAVDGRVGAAAAAVVSAATNSRDPGLGGNGSGIGGSGMTNGSRTPKHIASCLEILKHNPIFWIK